MKSDRSEKRASSRLHQREKAPDEENKRHRSRSPLRRSDGDEGRNDLIPKPLSKPVQASPVSTHKTSVEQASRRLHQREKAPDEENKRHRSRSPLTRSDGDEGRNDLIPKPLSKPVQTTPVTTHKTSVERASRRLHQSEKAPDEENKRHRSRSPLRRSDGDEGRNDPIPKPLSKPVQTTPVTTHKTSVAKERGFTGALQNGCVSRKIKTGQQDAGCLCKRPTLLRRLDDDKPSTQPKEQQHAQEKKRVSKKRKGEQDSKHPDNKLRQEDRPSPSITPDFKAIEGKTVLTVAIKIIPKDRVEMVKSHVSLPLEVDLMMLVSSRPVCPNIVGLVDWFDQPNQYVMILELPDPCEDLEMFCTRIGSLDEETAKRVMLQLIEALKHCETRRVFHRDVKPENILIRKDTQEVKLLDFGCGDFLKNTAYRSFAGTFLYAPPEWFHSRRYYARPATVWSVGVTLYRILCETLPFDYEWQILENQPYIPCYLSEECHHLIQWCLHGNPDCRPSLKEIERHPWFQ
ncbi:Serine/threonine-protein kinase pim-1 [Triplophysa tibetana]|uniref:non-specific serine/threonine protein kinase n=1 Tax=Triplophysa tibetana TaxID=1572043 RepID=A0A5A9NG68_9TELE|nr:Serine/threonine-protein kinase pim-1 [Triplophysa tibetana]